MDNLIGAQLGDYRIEARIGRGGMAKVYRAYQPSVGRPVAIKVIASDLAEAGDLDVFRERFAREANVIASLEHTHILPVYDYGIVNETAYLVMRLLDGGSLSDLIANGPLPLDRATDIFRQVGRGLAYAHSNGIIHRDLKPANILFSSTGDAYLTDFGLAKWIENSPVLTQSGKIIGTPVYMAPEQLRGDAIDQRADIYGMGIILYQMVTGELPFDSDTGDVVSIIYQHLEKIPLRPSEINPELPPGIDAVIMRALNKDASLRYANIMDMVHDLEAVMGYRPSTHDLTATPNMFPPTKPRRRRLNRSVVIGGLGVLVSIIVVAIGLVSVLNQPVETFQPTILSDTQGPAQTLIPDDETIARAQRVLGDQFIAFIACNQTSEYHATQAREMGDFAREYGLRYRVYDADNDEYEQLTQLERARTAGAGAFIMCLLDPELLANSLQSLEDADLPLVLMSSDVASYGGVMLVGDEYQMGFKPGELAGQIIAEEMNGEANVIILDYPDLPNLITRADGLEEGVLSVAPEANIVGRYLGAVGDFANESVTQLLNDGVEFNVIVSINDAGSFGAIEALEAAEIPPDEVVITSIDAEQLALRYIQEGNYMRGSVDVGREEFSRAAIDAVIQLLAGGTLPEQILVPPGDVITAEDLTNLE